MKHLSAILALLMCLALVLLFASCVPHSVSIGGIYMQTEIHGQEIRELLPVVLVTFPLGNERVPCRTPPCICQHCYDTLTSRKQ